MRFPNSTLSSTDFDVTLGFTQPEDPEKDTVKIRSFIDGDISLLDYGARQERIAEVTFINVEKTDFITIVNYLIENAGEKILIRTREGENLFPDVTAGGAGFDYYVYILEPKSLSEEDFSECRELFTITLRVALAGITSGAVPNEKGTQNLDILVEIDTTVGATKAATAPTPTVLGERWMDTDDNKIYKATNLTLLATATWTASSKTLTQTDGFANYTFTAGDYIYISGGTGVTSLGVHKVASKVDDDSITLETSIAVGDLATGDITSLGYWKYLYTVPANDATYGFVDGSFYISSFADIDIDVGDGTQSFISGLANYKGVQLPAVSVDISKGPNIARRQGFNFSLNNVFNSEKFWAFITDNKINLFGAKCLLYMYYASKSPSYTLWQTGFNKTNSFTYTDYTFKCEPFMLNDKGKVPSTVITSNQDRYEDIATDNLNKAPFITFGQFKYAMLQNVTSEKIVLDLVRTKINNSDTFPVNVTNIMGYIDATRLKIIIDISGDADYNSYTLTADQFSKINELVHTAKINFDSNTASTNVGEVRKITSIVNTGTTYELNLDSTLPTGTVADSHITFTITLYQYQYQIDEDVCGGIGSIDEEGVFQTSPIEIYRLSDSGKSLELVPSTEYTLNADKNLILLDPKVSNESAIITTYKRIGGDYSSEPFIHDIWRPIFTSPALKDPSNILSVPAGYDSDWYNIKYPDSSGTYIDDPYAFSRRVTAQSEPAKSTEILSKYPRTSRRDKLYMLSSFNIGTAEAGEDNLIGTGTSFNRNPGGMVDSYLASENVRLTMNVGLESQHVAINANIAGLSLQRFLPAPCKFFIRFRKKDGTVVFNTDWSIDFGIQNMGLGDYRETFGNTYGKFRINNEPSAEDSTFNEGTSLGAQPSTVWIVQFIVDNWNNRNDNTYTNGRFLGDRAFFCAGSITGVAQFNGTDWDEELTDSDGHIINYMPITSSVNKDPLTSWVSVGTNSLTHRRVFIIDSGSSTPVPLLRDSVVGVDWYTEPVTSGRDLFDLTADMFDTTGIWADVSTVEMYLIRGDLTADMFYPTSSFPADWNCFWLFKTRGPSIYTIEEMDITDQPLFASVQGRELSGAFTTSAKEISTAVMDLAYLNNYDAASLNALFVDGSERADWNFRRQFTSAMSSKDTLKELLTNVWAVAIFNSEDKIEFKSLETSALQGGAVALSDSNIIKDSITKVKFRNAEEIFQDFNLLYNYFIPSESSKALNEIGYDNGYRATEDEGNAKAKRYLEISRGLYYLENKLQKEFKYHYENFPIPDWVIEFYCFNSWSFKLKVAIELILGSDAITLMSPVSVSSYFHTGDVLIYGFVTSVKPDIYNGVAELGIYVVNPPDKFGAFCDLFNDALNVVTRDISGWTAANGLRNDAGNVETRTLGSFTQKDAGNVETRTFECP